MFAPSGLALVYELASCLSLARHWLGEKCGVCVSVSVSVRVCECGLWNIDALSRGADEKHSPVSASSSCPTSYIILKPLVLVLDMASR